MKHFSLARMAVIAGLLFAPALHAMEHRDHVIDKNGNPIMDARGNCVYTKWEVANGGCMGHTSIQSDERTIYFDFNKSSIRADQRHKLDSLIHKLHGAKDVQDVNIVGYTDQIGTNSYNKRLSVRRAQAVREYLKAHGHIHTNRIEVHGRGESDPVTDCSGATSRAERIKCMAPDRRVEIELNYAR